MKFAVVTLGSAGDLHPFLAIARELVERGHDVQLLSQAPYEGQSLAEGVPFRAIVDAAAHERTLTHPLLWHPLQGFGVLWRHLAVPAIEPTCEALGEMARSAWASGERLTVLASPLAAGARFARERWPDRIRLLSGYTAPMGLRSIDDPMFLGAWRVPRWAPPTARQLLWWLLDRWKLEPMSRPALQRWQSRWRTAPIETSAFGDWLHSPDGGVALYPREFAAVPLAWCQRGVVQTGFPLFEPRNPEALSPALAELIRRRSRYAVLYPGSAAAAAQRFTDLVLPACRELGLALVVLSPHLHGRVARQTSDPDSDVFTIDRAPLGRLLPGACLFVHHGGIGSVAQALKYAIPQLVLASAYDQFENGARLAELGAGGWHALSTATASGIGASFEHLLQAGSLAASHEPPWGYQTNGATEVSIARTCDILENSSASE